MAKPDHITDEAARALGADDVPKPITSADMPGPSPNPMTNVLIHEIALRSVGRISRMAVQKAVLGRQYGTQFAKDAIENRSIIHTLATYGVTKVATRSVPGALLVGGGLLAKTLYDRAQGKKKARRQGRKLLNKQAEEDSAL